MENETDEVVSGVSTLSMAVGSSGPLSFAEICDLGAEIAGKLADQHDEGEAHGHVAVGSVVRLDDGPWRLAPAELVPDVEPVRAPELQHDQGASAAGDVYALGAVLSYGLTGIAVEPVVAGAAGGEATVGSPTDAAGADLEAAEPGRIGVDADGEPTLELTADDLDRLRNFGDAPGPDDPDAADPDSNDPDSNDAALADPAFAADGSVEDDPTAAIDLTEDAADGPMTLPEVMSSFLVVLRSSLAEDPADRPSASSLAATLRQLRSDADSALGGALVGAAVTIGAAGEEPWGAPLYDTSSVGGTDPAGYGAAALTFEGSGAAASLAAAGAKPKTKKTAKDRLPMIVAVAAVVLALFLGVSLVRERNDKDADLLAVGPTVGTTVRRSTTTAAPALPVDLIVETTTTLASSTTSSTSTTAPPVQETVPDTTAPTTVPTTAAPATTAPPTTLPPTTTTAPAVPFKLAKVTCATPPNAANPCQLFEDADATSAARSGPLPAGVNLQATCITKGQPPFVGALDTWLYIIGPAPTYAGWLSATHLGGSIPQVPPCQASQTP